MKRGDVGAGRYLSEIGSRFQKTKTPKVVEKGGRMRKVVLPIVGEVPLSNHAHVQYGFV